MVIPVEIAVIAALGAIYYGYHAVKDEPGQAKTTSSQTPSAEPSALPKVDTTRLVSKRGGFAIGVPDNVTSKKVGPTVTMTSGDKVMTVVVAPIEAGTLAASKKAFMSGMKQTYTDVRETGSDAPTVDGHKAAATYGRAVTPKKVEIRFVNVVIKDTPRNYAINVFTAADADPLFVLPRVNAVVETFEFLK
jgi:hypothetical protein